MNNTVEKNNPKIFPKNEGKIKSKGMVAPPVPPKSSQAKFAGIKAIFERNAPHSQANKTVSSNLGRTFGPTMQKLMEDNIHSTPNKQRRDSGDSGISDVSSSTSDDENRIIKEKITKNVKQDNHQKSSNSHQTQATVDDMLFEEINDSTPCLTPQKSEVLTAAGNELKIIKFLRTLSKEERGSLGFSPKQQDNQKVETNKKTKKCVSPDRFKVRPLLCSDIDGYVAPDKRNSNLERCKVTHDGSELETKIERKHGFQSNPSIKHNLAIERCKVTHDGSELETKIERKHGFQSNPSIKHNLAIERCKVTHDGSELETKIERKHGFQSDPSIKHIKGDIAMCSITKGNDKKDIRPDASYEQEPLSEVSKVNVKELANRFRG